MCPGDVAQQSGNQSAPEGGRILGVVTALGFILFTASRW